MSITHQPTHTLRSIAADGRPAHRTGSDALRSSSARRRGSGSERATRGPLWLVLLMLFGAIGCSLSMGGALLAARQGSPPRQQVILAEWEQACRLNLEPDTSLQSLDDGETLYQGSVPGLGKFRAEYALDTGQAITLADLVLAVGQPHWGCLDYGLLRREPVIWVRLVLNQGQIEAYAPLSATTTRLRPDTPVHILYCYAPGEDYPMWQVGPWRGFTSVAAYQNCRHSGTATPR